MVASLRLLQQMIGIEIRSQMQYRLAFILELVTTGMANLIGFLTIALVLQRFENIGGWGLGEIAFLYGLVESAFGAMDMLFSGFDPDFFSRHIRLGRLDQMLLRPVNITLQVFGSRFMLRRIGRILQGLGIFIFALTLNPIAWTPGKLLYLPVVWLSLVLFFGALFIFGSTLTFWTVQPIEAVNIFTYGGTELMSYPMHIYQDWIRQFFTYVMPAIFLAYFPALYFLDRQAPFTVPGWAPFCAPVVGAGLFYLSHCFWRFGLRFYQSTGT